MKRDGNQQTIIANNPFNWMYKFYLAGKLKNLSSKITHINVVNIYLMGFDYYYK